MKKLIKNTTLINLFNCKYNAQIHKLISKTSLLKTNNIFLFKTLDYINKHNKIKNSIYYSITNHYSQCKVNRPPIDNGLKLSSVSEKIDLRNISENCYIEQVQTGCISHFGYYIESEGNSMIIDPIRDIEFYLKIIKDRNSSLKYIGETHFHADFISGHYELSQKTGAPIIYGPGAKAEFRIVNAKNNSIYELSSKIKIQVIHTPGHTLESVCFCILEKVNDNDNEFKKIALFTGDTIFLGDVGRPDLAVKSNVSSKDLASMMYDSIQVIKKLPDNILILPGHGAGSACGKNIESGTVSTLGKQKQTNYAFNNELKKDEFIEILTSNISAPPQYFFFDAEMNHKTLNSIDHIIKNSKKPITILQYNKMVNDDKSIKTIDTRDYNEVYKTGIIKGSYCISLDTSYAIWAATLLKPTDRVIIVSNKGKEEESIKRLARVGFENIIGYLENGINDWINNNYKTVKINTITAEETINVINKDNDDNVIIDVRTNNEHKSKGLIKNSICYPLNEFEENINILKDSKNNLSSKNIYIVCKGGIRATIASSIINKYYDELNVYVVEGGMDNLERKGFKPDKI